MAKDKSSKEKKDRSQAANPPAGNAHLVALVVHGDFRAARADARKVLADPAATEADKAAASDILGRITIENGALSVGLILAATLAVIATLVLR